MNTLQGEAWDLASEYPAPDAPEVERDWAALGKLLAAIEEHNQALSPALEAASTLDAAEAEPLIARAHGVFALVEEAARLLFDLDTYAECLLSVDSQDAAAQALLGRLVAVRKRFGEARVPLSQFLDLAPDAVAERFLADHAVAPARFAVTHARQRRHEVLPLAQEALADALAQDGIHAWGRLYDQLAGTLTCTVRVEGEDRTLGLAAASALLLRPDDALRERAWRAVNGAWEANAESCAAAINAIAGWRLEMCKRRSRDALMPGPRAVHFLDAPVHANRIARATLDTVLGIAEEGAPLARRAARLQARAYGKARYGPWDLRAPVPAHGNGGDHIPYGEAIDLIADAYGGVHPSMGDFVRMMADNRWIEGTVGPRKHPGAYCTAFRKSRTPRVYMTYTGGTSDVIILAHELGHAFHAWVMRDLPECQRGYGMAIAETASTFGEATVRDALLRRAKTPAERLAIVWEEAAALTSFVLNIPARFAFERDFYTARAESPQRPEDLGAMMSAAWEACYGDCLAEPDPLFWASKLHFYISDLSFYNFPYLFGYLFSLGVHTQRDAMGDAFFERYRALLRDTGRMSAEDLAAKHLDADLTKPDFWRRTLTHLATRIDDFEQLIEQVREAPTR